MAHLENKRPREDNDGGTSSMGAATLSDFTQLMEQCRNDIQQSHEKTFAKFYKAQCDRFDLVENQVKTVTKDVEVIKESVNDNKEEMVSLKKQMAEIKERLENNSQTASSTEQDLKKAKEKITQMDKEQTAVQDRIGLLQTPGYVAPPISPNWERPARPDVLSIGAREPVSLDAIKASVEAWLAPLAYPTDSYRIDGPKMGRNFDLLFNGEFVSVESAALRANKANLLLRKENGSWTQLTAKDENANDVELYISKDEMPKHKREITLAKRLHKAIERNIGANPNIYVHKKFRVIRHKAVQFVKVECESFEKFQIMWDMDEVAKLKISKEAVLQDFHSRTGVAPNTKWVV